MDRAHDIYSFIYELPVLYEDLKVGGDGWYRLGWRPIWKGNFNIYLTNQLWKWSGSLKFVGFRWYDTGAHNGWNRSWDAKHMELGFFFFTLNIWLIYNVIVHKDGPSDGSKRRPLTIPEGVPSV